jgi:hypothetical protein
MDIGEGALFHMAPSVCLKFRGIKRTPKKLKEATEPALTSYVASKEREPEVLSRPRMAFAFCYLAAHFGLDLLEEDEVGDTMDFIEREEETLDRLIAEVIKAGERTGPGGASPLH